MKPIISIFLIVVIGVAFFVVIANTLNPVTNLQTSNDSINITSARINGLQINTTKTYTITHYPNSTGVANTPVTSFVLLNGSGATATLTTDYLINTTTGVLSLKNSTFWVSNSIGNTTYAQYNYATDTYVADSGANSMLGLVQFLTALGILLAVVGYLNWDYLKEWFGY